MVLHAPGRADDDVDAAAELVLLRLVGRAAVEAEDGRVRGGRKVVEVGADLWVVGWVGCGSGNEGLRR